MYNPWGSAGIGAGQQQQQGAQPWGATGLTAEQQQQAAQAGWGGDAAAAAAAAAAGGAYYQQQYYQQQAAAAGQQAIPPSAATYFGAAAGQPAVAAPAPPGGVRTWTGQVSQIIPPNYGVIDGDAYYINAVVVGEVPKVRWLLGRVCSRAKAKRIDERRLAWRLPGRRAAAHVRSLLTLLPLPCCCRLANKCGQRRCPTRKAATSGG